MEKTRSYSIEEQLSARAYVEYLDDNTLCYIIRTILTEHFEDVLILQKEGSKNK